MHETDKNLFMVVKFDDRLSLLAEPVYSISPFSLLWTNRRRKRRLRPRWP